VEDQPTTLWTLRKAERLASCRVKLVPYGVEVDVLADGALIVTRVFENGDEALAWAEEKRAARAAQGWRTDEAG